ncbi:hypothetical protein Pla123a_37590 [Posidoniimonas polymericola]|uniref:DUF1269 domain-containing protein n=1 Tax=Posidoniimonas polymericola TaxID=2528002 RepID=A0A5C5YEF5_9BACT|nr:hypothetical protein [Posidoniimonas polymericola]TWT73424.1 hypothetical protein Pla123a_37590 [Posidoniimonas polymericola]
MQNDLEEAIERDGIVAVFDEEGDAVEAFKRISSDARVHADVRLVRGSDAEHPLLLAPREPQAGRTRAIGVGVAVGAAAGLAIGVVVGMLEVFTQLPSIAMPGIGAALGVLVGGTTAGLGLSHYREDTQAELDHHLKNGKVLLLALGERPQLRRVKQLVGHARPATLIEPTS